MTPKQFEQVSGLSIRQIVGMVGCSEAAYKRWKSGKVQMSAYWSDQFDQHAARLAWQRGDYDGKRLNELPVNIKEAIIRQCYEQGAAADMESECPYGGDIGRRCAWMAGFWDSVRVRQ